MLKRMLALTALATLLGPAISFGQFKQKDFDLNVSGSGANDKEWRTYNATVAGQLGYFVTDQLELGIRPQAQISDGGSQWIGLIPVFADYHFDLGSGWVPYVGGNIGYQFSAHQFNGAGRDGWIAGPEIGLKYFLNGTTYVFGQMSYEFNLNRGGGDGAFFYGLGLGVKL